VVALVVSTLAMPGGCQEGRIDSVDRSEARLDPAFADGHASLVGGAERHLFGLADLRADLACNQITHVLGTAPPKRLDASALVRGSF
jgi:hypothetical protein